VIGYGLLRDSDDGLRAFVSLVRKRYGRRIGTATGSLAAVLYAPDSRELCFRNLETRNSPNPIATRSSGMAIAKSGAGDRNPLVRLHDSSGVNTTRENLRASSSHPQYRCAISLSPRRLCRCRSMILNYRLGNGSWERASTAPIGGFMNNLLKQAVSLSLFVKCPAAVVGILLIHITFRVLEQILPGALPGPMRAIKFASSSCFPDTSRFFFFSLSSLKIAWAA
jgi:hypothetical protein